ncbi:MAG: Sec-independent protein translocase protein TatB [Pseudomonadales bacterium]|jgi:sec-independent protein translocase protein TatB|nr:Sec-independent protein translocase protein TatB [Pseudomonadales bacterium]
MFDIGFPELLLVSVVMLLVFGPERLPEVLRSVGRFVGSARRSFESLRSELEREVGADEIRRELHNARIMEEARKLDSMVRAERDEVEELLGERYAALKHEGALEEDASTGAADDEPAPVAPIPDEGNDESVVASPVTDRGSGRDAATDEAEPTAAPQEGGERRDAGRQP